MARHGERRAARVRPGLGAEAGHPVALLLVDVVNPLDFPGSAPLAKRALPMARRLARLAKRFRNEGLPVIYVNDNFGRWESDWRKVIRYCTAPGLPGRRMSATLRPQRGDYFVLKPKHSGFFSTTLDVLLRHLGARTLVLTGVATDICILATAQDAYMRDYRLFVPRDCVAAQSASANRFALSHINALFKADLRPSARIVLARPLHVASRAGAKTRTDTPGE
jgi:nicotinamidase-related amidase